MIIIISRSVLKCIQVKVNYKLEKKINCGYQLQLLEFFKIYLDQNVDQLEDDKLIPNSTTTTSFTVMLIPFCSINFINSIPDLQLTHMDRVLCCVSLYSVPQFKENLRGL